MKQWGLLAAAAVNQIPMSREGRVGLSCFVCVNINTQPSSKASPWVHPYRKWLPMMAHLEDKELSAPTGEPRIGGSGLLCAIHV